jgi:hypothetical protein
MWSTTGNGKSAGCTEGAEGIKEKDPSLVSETLALF